MITIKKHIPNTITCLNMFSGCMATYFAFSGEFTVTLIFILLAAVFDFCDGMAARALKAYSPIGKELDSLADMISFGLAPGALVFTFLSYTANKGYAIDGYLPFVGFLITVFSGLRLAKFNIDERQTTSFIGVPTPANAIFWAGLLFSYYDVLREGYLPYIVAVWGVVMAFLLIAEIPLFSLKFHNLKWQDNKVRYVFLIGCVVLLILFRQDALMWIILWYLVLALSVLLIPAKRNSK